ncbi:LOB domain-containing protein 4 [Iris pallida]|uniref:LOB domain-containing protein 4 n=1 Tax=Iris pallida TaxID=29817 RepID=A0AAX6DXU3_IRIPA|nr:LOB domain-containing protein 4 [Iris pallida]
MKEVMGRKLQGTVSPCAACKLLRRRCTQDCLFAPYFPADEPLKFANVHKVFGASNVNKLLQELPVQHRSDAVSSMVYEANARVRDPVYGCVGAISSLQHQVDALQAQLALAQAEMFHMRARHAAQLAHLGAQCNNLQSPIGRSAATTTTTANTASSGSPSASTAPMSPTSSELIMEMQHHARSFFALDMADQANMGQLMWSC